MKKLEFFCFFFFFFGFFFRRRLLLLPLLLLRKAFCPKTCCGFTCLVLPYSAQYLKINIPAHGKYCTFITKTKPLSLFREIIAVYREDHTRHTKTLCGQNAQFQTVKAGGAVTIAGLITVDFTPCERWGAGGLDITVNIELDLLSVEPSGRKLQFLVCLVNSERRLHIWTVRLYHRAV
jgi:hypothetical protein